MFPQISKTERRMEELKQAYGSSTRKRIGNSYYVDYRGNPPSNDGRKAKLLSAKQKANKKKAVLKGSAGEQSDDE
jgi:hypothetical protein